MAILIAKILIVTAKNDNEEYTFQALEFENGLCCVSRDSKDDSFFVSRNDINPQVNTDIIVKVEDSGETELWDHGLLAHSLSNSVVLFQYNHAITLGWELIKSVELKS